MQSENVSYRAGFCAGYFNLRGWQQLDRSIATWTGGEGAQCRLIASLADELLIAYAEPGGKTEALASEALAWGKPLYALDHPANAGLLKQGMDAYALPGQGSS